MIGCEPLTRESLEGLAAFLPIFEAPSFTFGEWSSSDSPEPGVIVVPMYMLSPDSDLFIQALYDLGWIRTDFDWTKWADTPEAVRLRDDPQAILTATPEQLAKLLTAVVRSDRFCEGTLAECIESGLLLRVLRRANSLCNHQS
ncbi:MAG: DUF6508 domain-containing protein [Planctomycetota bacterium]|nr:DUF6508 domain-containing protein [Planctomycetota bacterium]